MNFECLLLSAKAGNEDAITTILQMYRPLLLKYAIIDGVLDEDLYQELSIGSKLSGKSNSFRITSG